MSLDRSDSRVTPVDQSSTQSRIENFIVLFADHTKMWSSIQYSVALESRRAWTPATPECPANHRCLADSLLRPSDTNEARISGQPPVPSRIVASPLRHHPVGGFPRNDPNPLRRFAPGPGALEERFDESADESASSISGASARALSAATVAEVTPTPLPLIARHGTLRARPGSISPALPVRPGAPHRESRAVVASSLVRVAAGRLSPSVVTSQYSGLAIALHALATGFAPPCSSTFPLWRRPSTSPRARPR